MRRLYLLSVALLLLLVSCKTGPLKDIRLGKSFAVIIPDKVLIHSRPVLDSETFRLEEAEEFLVEDVVCEDGMKTGACYWELTTAPSNPDIVKIVFYKVRFESGREGYINGRYFYPELSYYMTSEELQALHGSTPGEYAAQDP